MSLPPAKVKRRPSRHKRERHRVVEASSLPDLVDELQQGLPFERLTQFLDESGLSYAEAEGVLRIPRRTLARRREQGRLSWEESERLHRLSELFQRTLEVFRGNEPESRNWLTRPCRALGDVAPLDMASTETGAREVERVLGRLQHGVFS
jgi:putative toxin-antitoxin system antitoxin component (TIGR02293 family)